ncbi:MAG: hypothetical protein V1703_00980, partial [Candidatus Altiarchaeota archaeon]
LSGRMLREVLKTMKDDFHLDYAAVYGRLPRLTTEFHSAEEARTHLQEYVARRREKDGLHPDWAVRFHQYAGCEVVCGIPDYAEDPHSFNHGFVGIYDLERLAEQGKLETGHKPKA